MTYSVIECALTAVNRQREESMFEIIMLVGFLIAGISQS